MHGLIFILLYVDDVVLFSYNQDEMQQLLDVLDTFCQKSGLIVNVDKTKMIGIKAIKARHFPMFTYKGE